MADTTIKKVKASESPKGDKGQRYLVSGTSLAMRMWDQEEPTDSKTGHTHEYEVVGFAISGRATLHLEGQEVILEPGDSWLVPANAEHRYTIEEPFTAIEATSPPARQHGG